MEKIKWILNQMPKNEDKNLAVMALDNVNQARKFHRSFPQYSVTPLAKLDGMAGQLGLGGLFVKDESYRFGLNAFKVLGLVLSQWQNTLQKRWVKMLVR